jgi:hypothetical protein
MAKKSDRGAGWLSRKTDFQTGIEADESEFSALRFGQTNVDDALRDEIRTGVIDDAARPDGEWPNRDSLLEGMAANVAEEIERRTLLLGEAYPFVREKNKLTYRRSKSGIYEFCLAVTMAPSLSNQKFCQLPVAFEFLARDTLRLFAGPRATAFRTGAPPVSQDKLPARGKKLFAHLNTLTGEWRWRPHSTLPASPPYTHAKDFGLDVVTWLPVPGIQLGHLFFLGQCACGTSGWTSKWKDLNLERLHDWMELVTAVQPVRCFLVPFHIGNPEMLREVCRDAGLVFDRTRITLIAHGIAPNQLEPLKPYWHWVDLVSSGPFKKPRKKKRRSSKKARQ